MDRVPEDTDPAAPFNPAIERAINAIKFVAQHVKNEDNFEGVSKK